MPPDHDVVAEAAELTSQGVVMNKSNQAIMGIAEISLRVHDLPAMRRFYEEVVGLKVLREIEEEGSKTKAVF